MTPRISVIVPSLNTAAYIREALESLSSQTLHDIEVLCVDAGSTDGTKEAISEFAARDRRFRLLESSVKSYGSQMNMGISEARGDYIGIVEPDDWIEPDMYATLVEEADRDGLDFVKSDVLRFWDSGSSPRCETVSLLKGCPDLYGQVFDPADRPESVLAPTLATWAGVYRRSFLSQIGFRYHESPGASYQDAALYVASFAFARKCKFLRRALYHYRQDNAAASSQRRDVACLVRNEYKYIWTHCLEGADKGRLDVFRPYFLALQFGGEVFTANRLPSAERAAFWAGFRNDFIDQYRAGAFRRDLMPDGHWIRLRRTMEGDGAVGLFERLRVCLAENGVRRTLCHLMRKVAE